MCWCCLLAWVSVCVCNIMRMCILMCDCTVCGSTVHGHASENEIFLFVSYSCSSNPYFLYYSLIGVEDWSLRLNEFHLGAIARLQLFQTSHAIKHHLLRMLLSFTPAFELPLHWHCMWIIHYRRLMLEFSLAFEM